MHDYGWQRDGYGTWWHPAYGFVPFYSPACPLCAAERTGGLLDVIASVLPHQQSQAQASAMVHAQASSPGWGLQLGQHAPSGSWGSDYENALLRLQGPGVGPGAATGPQYR